MSCAYNLKNCTTSFVSGGVNIFKTKKKSVHASEYSVLITNIYEKPLRKGNRLSICLKIDKH